MAIVVVGSVALDTIRTPFGRREEILGGSATFFSVAASFFHHTEVIATVGSDFPKRHLTMLKERGIGTAGLHVASGKTFRWKGRYGYDLNTAHTIATHLNVFQHFRPVVPKALRHPKTLFLANIDPELQLSVLRQVSRPRLVAADTMNYWITEKRAALEKVLERVDIFLVNEGEARQLSGEHNLLKAAHAITALGPRAVVIKKGEHGVLFFSKKSHFVAPAYPLESVYDPTGAGDSFAGGMIGFLSSATSMNDATLRRSIVYGSIVASFAVEDFSVNRLLEISRADIKARYAAYRKMTVF